MQDFDKKMAQNRQNERREARRGTHALGNLLWLSINCGYIPSSRSGRCG